MGRIYPVSGFPRGALHRIIYADPPWQYRDKLSAGKRGASYKYPTMDMATLRALPVRGVAADDCTCFLWTTGPMMPEAVKVLAAWGFSFKTIAFVWVKPNLDGTWFKGMGQWSRGNAEFVLLGVKGKPQRQHKGISQLVQHLVIRKPHSAKPPEVRDRIVELMGDQPRIELFARTIPVDWDGWGLEARFMKDNGK